MRPDIPGFVSCVCPKPRKIAIAGNPTDGNWAVLREGGFRRGKQRVKPLAKPGAAPQADGLSGRD